MNYRALTAEEERYLERGERVFLVGNENEVVILKKNVEPYFMCNHGTGEIYKFSSVEFALAHAWTTASLSEDKPMVEGVIVGILETPPKRTLRT